MKLILPATALFSFLSTMLLYYFYILTGRHYKMLEIANQKLRENTNNASVNEYLQILSKTKRVPTTKRNSSLLLEAYTLIKDSKAVNEDLKTQFRVTVLLKGLDKV